ncbi:hypothetical protein [Streptomyces laurentii]|uniref:hypothetical protein n=1 Tax=Streptomyces laurentii TaxID=39478 RepID=UPI0033F42937
MAFFKKSNQHITSEKLAKMSDRELRLAAMDAADYHSDWDAEDAYLNEANRRNYDNDPGPSTTGRTSW